MAAIGAGVAVLVAARLAPPLPGIWTSNTLGLIASALVFAAFLMARRTK